MENISGKRFGRLIALRPTYTTKGIWECICDCGNLCYPKSSSLNSGATQSCGCLASELSAQRSTKIHPDEYPHIVNEYVFDGDTLQKISEKHGGVSREIIRLILKSLGISPRPRTKHTDMIKGRDQKKIITENQRTAKFWLNVVIKSENECWEWTGSINKTTGYGVYRRTPLRISSPHQFSYFQYFGELPEDKPWVLHKCDNPLCVNPNHLYAGTPKDNSLDRENRQRGNHSSTLLHTRYPVPDILKDRLNGYTYDKLMEKYDIPSLRTLIQITKRYTLINGSSLEYIDRRKFNGKKTKQPVYED